MRTSRPESLIGLVPDARRFPTLRLAPAPAPAPAPAQLTSLSTHESYFILCAWLRDLQERKGADLSPERWGLLLRSVDIIASSALPCYLPSVCKVLDVLAQVVESEAFSSSDSYSNSGGRLAEQTLALLLAVKGLLERRQEVNVLPLCVCKLIDNSVTTQLGGHIVVLSHRLVNQIHRHHGPRLGKMALDSLGIMQQSVAHNLSLLCSNDCWVISFLLDRTEIYLRIKQSTIPSQQPPLLLLIDELLDPIVAHLCFLTICGFNESIWIDMLNGEETCALEYLTRLTKLLAVCKSDAWAEATSRAALLLPIPPFPSAASQTTDGILATALTVVWEVPASSQQLTCTIPEEDWAAWSTLPAAPAAAESTQTVTTLTPSDIAQSAMEFYRRLSLQLKAASSKRCLVFDPHLLCARMDAFISSLSGEGE